MTIYDRYLLRRFWHVFAIGFFATFGLFVVFDAFTNADEFQDRSGGVPAMLARMTQHYFFQSFSFLDLLGPTLAVVSVIAVFAMLQRQREVYPVLSAGVPTYRIAFPVLVGVLSVVVLMTVNQELILPEIAPRLQVARGTDKAMISDVQTSRDFVTNVEITGSGLDLESRSIDRAEFLLPVPSVVAEPATLKAKRAVYIPPQPGEHPAGWLLKDPSPTFDKLKLTEQGTTLVFAVKSNDPTVKGGDIFVATEVTIDQLHSRGTSFKFLSTSDLVQRIRNPAVGAVSIRVQTVHLHERLTRPFAIILAALIAIPLTMKKESRGLLESMGMCCVVLSVLFVISQASLQLGRLNFYPLALGAWIPVVLAGGLSAWFSNRVQT